MITKESWLKSIMAGICIGVGGIVYLSLDNTICNLMIYIAVENFKSNPHTLGKYLAIFLGVMVFILAGFEHCVANMFYFSVANMWSLRTVLYLLVMTAGNMVGGLIPEMVRRVSASQK